MSDLYDSHRSRHWREDDYEPDPDGSWRTLALLAAASVLLVPLMLASMAVDWVQQAWKRVRR